MDRPRSLLVFLVLTFAASWAFFVPVAVFSGPELSPLAGLAITAGAVMPGIVALLLAGHAGRAAPLARLTRWNAGAGAYAFALLFPVGLELAGALLHRALEGAWPRFDPGVLAVLPFAILLSTPVQAGEEIGWRGYALPALASRMGTRAASLALGAIWAVWHLPLFFVRGAETWGQSFPLYALQVIGLSVVFGWLFARTGALLPVMVLHATFNNVKDLVPAALAGGHETFGWHATPAHRIGVALLLAIAIGLLAAMPKRVAEPPAS